MKKFASGFMAILMAGVLPMSQVHASEVTLESAIQNLQYRLTVEWDQKDSKKQREIMAEFEGQVEALRKQGLSDEKIFKTLAASAFDPQTAKDLEALAKYAKEKKLDQKEARKLVLDYVNKSGGLGANWSSTASVALLLGVLIGIIIVVRLLDRSPSYGCYDDCWYDYYWDEWYCDTYCY